MNAPAKASLRRGACPGLSAPMATGDGLLARLTPAGSTIGLDALAGFCAAAKQHGNGIVEVTSRGSLQARGLSAVSSPLFAADVVALGIEASDGIPVTIDPLAGLEERPAADARGLAWAIRSALEPLAARLSAKVSVAVDGGASLHLDAVAADVRVRMVDDLHVQIALAGDARRATPLGVVSCDDAAECVRRLLSLLAGRAPQARMREAIEGEGPTAFRSVVAGLIDDGPAPPMRPPAEPLGIHRLRQRRMAAGLALPFGHADAKDLRRIIDAAWGAGAAGVRCAPDHALLFVDLTPAAADCFLTEVAAAGFIVNRADPRRRVVACAGAPICGSGEIATRAMAPAVAAAAQALPEGERIHLSGCVKGCAYQGRAAITVTGRDRRCDVVADGAAVSTVTPDALPAEIERRVRLRGRAR